jgi:hypothetical protein
VAELDVSRIARVKKELFNGSTRMGVSGTHLLDKEILQQRWEMLVPGLRSMPPDNRQKSGFRIFWASKETSGYCDLYASKGAYLIIGRHRCCDIVLEEDEHISLRHLMAIPIQTETGALGLRLMDLRASLEFYFNDNQPRRNALLSGPVGMRLGAYVLGVLPFSASGELSAPDRLPEPHFLNDTDEQTVFPRSFAQKMVIVHKTQGKVVDELEPISSVSFFPNPILLAEIQASKGDVQLVAHYKEEGAVMPLMDAELRTGILVGRSERCQGGKLHALMNHHVSRVHALLIRIGKSDWLFDTGSTNGIFSGKTKIRAMKLQNTGSAFRLGSEHGVYLHWRTSNASD